jgi:hypothetical protein
VWKGEIVTERAKKFDSVKLPIQLIPPEALVSMAQVLAFGIHGKGYEANNWLLGMDWSRLFGATNRHLWSWYSRTPHDRESGLSELKHAQTGINFLITYEERGLGKDDRPEGVPSHIWESYPALVDVWESLRRNKKNET